MFRVFLVEDEAIFREGIRESVEWEKTGFVLAGEAPDGEAALPLIEEIRPDILITDIKMPFMDGLALSRTVKRSMPSIKIAIISGYDEFPFAREAIAIGVTDYLLKPVTAGDLLATLNRMAAQIEKEARARENLDSLNRCLKDSRQVMAERFLNDLVAGVVPSADALEKAEGFGINLAGRCYIVAVITPEVREQAEPRRRYAELLKAEGWIRHLLEGNPDVIRFSRNLTEIVLIFKGEDSGELESHCFAVCQSLKVEVERKTACTLTIGVGGAQERIQGIGGSFTDAQTANRFRYIFGRSRIVGIDDTRRANFKSRDILRLDGSGIVEALRSGEREEIVRALQAYMDRIGDGTVGPFLLGYAALTVVLAIARFVEELGGAAEDVLPGLDRLEGLLSPQDPESSRRYLTRVLLAAFEYRESCRKNKYADIILRARTFIGEHYADPGISLNTIAGHVHVSPSHFSAIFSQETGQTVIECLTGARIAKARELLKSSSLRSSEIAYQVGYKDPHYFSYIFRRHCGCTPSEFRESK
jgi:two-component system response regulator YesN